MSCPRAFIASVTTACSPPLAARPTSPPLVSCCISRRPGLPPTAALITAVHDPPLCAGIAVPRCSSSRSSHAPNRSVRPRLHRSRHEHPPLTRQIFPVGASSNQADTIAHAHCTGYRAFLYSPPATTRILPLRDCRPRCRGRRARSRHQASRAHCLRSNPHSSSLPLTPSVRLRGFLPWGLPDVCPHPSPGMARSAPTGRHRATLNITCRSLIYNYSLVADVHRLHDFPPEKPVQLGRSTADTGAKTAPGESQHDGQAR